MYHREEMAIRGENVSVIPPRVQNAENNNDKLIIFLQVFKPINRSSLLVPAAALQLPFFGTTERNDCCENIKLIKRPVDIETDKSSGKPDDVPTHTAAACAANRVQSGRKNR